MIVDTSAWIEYLRNSDSGASSRIAAEIERESNLIVPEQVLMELLIGPIDEPTAHTRRRFLHRFHVEPIAALSDCEEAAAIHRRCRREGKAVRNLIDCQIAAMAFRLKMPILHRDRDFEVIRAHCGLLAEPLF